MVKSTVRVSIDQLQNLIVAVLVRAGMAPENAAPVAHSLAVCEQDGVKTHGILRIDGFIDLLKSQSANGTAHPELARQAGSILSIDAHGGFAQVALAAFRDEAMAIARSTGVAIMTIGNSHHSAAIWPDIEPIAADGFIAFSCVSSRKRMTVWGGHSPVVGTNAMAFAVPRIDENPFVWDQSTSLISYGEVLLAARTGRDVQEGAGCDAQGKPTTSPQEILDGGALLPFGGAKGAALAVMVDILAAGLSGGSFGFEYSPPSSETPSRGGQFLLIIDPLVANPTFDTRVSMLFDALRDAGADRLPGDRRYQAREISRVQGIEVDGESYERLRELAQQQMPRK